jgi:tRNA(Ile)-lysidine synthase
MMRSQKPGHGRPEIPDWMPDSKIHAILAPLANARALLLAISGGPDSTALLLMASHWARLRGGPRLEAATVDHGLRLEGAAEAEKIAKLCESLSVPHHTLLWGGSKRKKSARISSSPRITSTIRRKPCCSAFCAAAASAALPAWPRAQSATA